MPRKKTNSVQCVGCKLTITEPKTSTQIREKLRALGWRFKLQARDLSGEGVVEGKCGKCCTGEQCSFYRPARFAGKLEDMVSPWMEQ